ncbi:methyltransferase domain-containing protein [Lipomyces oligophaga]|uniref:methyltransferase domain-containing protein n=1 Tax=Lipomyces oligophaga TaxID=45792 RepID=UPI0034CF934D
MIADNAEVEKLNSSKLGTKQYWNDFYNVEQTNFADNSDDEGEIWFADSDAEDKIVDFIIDHTSSNEISDEFPFSKTTTTAIDLGTGNGHLLFRVRSECGMANRLCGVDYSETSVEFAIQILKKKVSSGEIDNPNGNIVFECSNFLTLPAESENQGWDLVLDKGTLDAIALSQDIVKDGMTGVELYPLAVRDKLVRIGGIILITSCNFTEQELIKLMTVSGLSVWKTIKYPVYEFGGIKGQSISSVAFIRSNET